MSYQGKVSQNQAKLVFWNSCANADLRSRCSIKLCNGARQDDGFMLSVEIWDGHDSESNDGHCRGLAGFNRPITAPFWQQTSVINELKHLLEIAGPSQSEVSIPHLFHP